MKGIATCWTMSVLLTIGLAAGAAEPGPPTSAETLLADLLEGIELDGGLKLLLPSPTVNDEMDPGEVQTVIGEIVAKRYRAGDFFRRSVVAPQWLELGEIPCANPTQSVRKVDLWFVAYGDIATIADRNVPLGIDVTDVDGKGIELSAEQLDQRGIPPTASFDAARFVHFNAPILDRVCLEATVLTAYSRSDRSLLFVSRLDPRFTGDAEFPNQWRSMQRTPGNEFELGPAVAYDGMAMYMKATQLAQPEGAILIEYHHVFVEPKDWFGGANLLRSKLPMAIQQQVRTFRRELLKASR